MPNELVSEDVKKFLEIRPYFELNHVIDIEQVALDHKAPFCQLCSDWHHPANEHTVH